MPQYKTAKSVALDGREVQVRQDDDAFRSGDHDDEELMRRWLGRFVRSRSWDRLAGGTVVLSFPATSGRPKSAMTHPPFPTINLFSPWIPRRRTSKAKFAKLLKSLSFVDPGRKNFIFVDQSLRSRRGVPSQLSRKPSRANRTLVQFKALNAASATKQFTQGRR